jgi:hypothetical protein
MSVQTLQLEYHFLRWDRIADGGNIVKTIGGEYTEPPLIEKDLIGVHQIVNQFPKNDGFISNKKLHW